MLQRQLQNIRPCQIQLRANLIQTPNHLCIELHLQPVQTALFVTLALSPFVKPTLL
jgi:hypothetical protein